MISVVVLMVISSLYLNFITSVFMLQQTLSHVCRRTNNYFVALLCTSLSSFLLQDLDQKYCVTSRKGFKKNSHCVVRLCVMA